MSTFGTRLRDERNRINKTQAELCAVGGCNVNTQSNYERDKQSPTVDYLLNIGAVGVDVMYLLYGVRAAMTASARVNDLLEVLTQLAPEQQAIGFAMLTILRRTSEGQSSIENAEAFWQAAKLFEGYLGLPDAHRKVVETAVRSLQAKVVR